MSPCYECVGKIYMTTQYFYYKLFLKDLQGGTKDFLHIFCKLRRKNIYWGFLIIAFVVKRRSFFSSIQRKKAPVLDIQAGFSTQNGRKKEQTGLEIELLKVPYCFFSKELAVVSIAERKIPNFFNRVNHSYLSPTHKSRGKITEFTDYFFFFCKRFLFIRFDTP